ncbi:MAG: efflux RND transporter periplasmic adaptor subunit [Xanthomonadales bacterium]
MNDGLIRWVARCGMLIFISMAVLACDSKEADSNRSANLVVGSRVLPVRVAKAQTREILVELYAVGRLVSRNSPSLAAEIDARVVEVLVKEGEAVHKGQELVLLDTTSTELARREAQADIERLQATIDNEQRRVTRYRDLKARDMMPQESLDDAEAQLAVSRAALTAAEARLAVTQDQLARARLQSPFAGVVETRYVSVGDFATVGRPLIKITDTQALWARLPFPETVGYQLKEGLDVFIESPLAPGQVVQARIDQIRPQVGSMNRALIVIADVINPGFWRPGATIEARVVVERRADAVVVPGISVVSRPAGDVVYLLDSGHVRQRVVETGEILDGWVEIRSGLSAGNTVVTEGAYYLTDGAAVSIREPGSE